MKDRTINIGKTVQAVKGPSKSGSPFFYRLLEEMAETHDKKSHDYASNLEPYANYEFAGWLAHLFKHSELDMGFVSRIGEKLYRLANLEGSNKIVKNESIEDTERDLCVIMTLWMAARRDKRSLTFGGSAVAGGLNPEYSSTAPEQPTNALSAMIALEPLLSQNQIKTIIQYLQECESARSRLFYEASSVQDSGTPRSNL